MTIQEQIAMLEEQIQQSAQPDESAGLMEQLSTEEEISPRIRMRSRPVTSEETLEERAEHEFSQWVETTVNITADTLRVSIPSNITWSTDQVWYHSGASGVTYISPDPGGQPVAVPEKAKPAYNLFENLVLV